jgi:phosphatidylglycerophosphate synthase
MESIRELEVALQTIRRSTDDWYMWNVLRKVSIRVTWLFLHTPINANGVTTLFIVFGFLISGVFLIGTKTAFLAGALMMQFWYVLDMVDGEVARYRKESVATGRFFDYMAHYIVHPFFFMSVGLGLHLRYGNFAIFLVSILAAHSMTLMAAIMDVQYSVLYRRLKIKIFKPDEKIVFREMAGEGIAQEKPSIIKRCFSCFHRFTTFPTLIYIMTALSILNMFVKPELFFAWVAFYAVGPTVVSIARITVFIREKKIDQEYTELDRAINALKK